MKQVLGKKYKNKTCNNFKRKQDLSKHFSSFLWVFVVAKKTIVRTVDVGFPPKKKNTDK